MEGAETRSLPLGSEVPLTGLNTLGLPSTARWLLRARSAEMVAAALEWAGARGLTSLYLGEGSNVVLATGRYDGLVILNQLFGRSEAGGQVELAGGENLMAVIRWANSLGLCGLERMYGIPGTVAGALIGNAGAYGQEIGDRVVDVEVVSPDGLFRMSREELGFGYRTSIFKRRRDWFLLGCRLRLTPAVEDLGRVSKDIVRLRRQKYPDGLRCPGSFFKNVLVADLTRTELGQIPPAWIQYGKIPAGRLLEAVGANGRRRGDAAIASYHGNLFVNLGNASAEELLGLADETAGRVFERFGIRLEPEVRIIGEGRWPGLETETETRTETEI